MNLIVFSFLVEVNGTPQASERLELAKRLASRIHIAKNLGPDAKGASQQTAEAILKGGLASNHPVITAKTVAEQLAAKLNTRLNYQPKDEDGESECGDNPEAGVEETFRKYEEELEINDFPQQARWRVTSKVSKEILVDSFVIHINILIVILGGFSTNIRIFRGWYNSQRYLLSTT